MSIKLKKFCLKDLCIANDNNFLEISNDQEIVTANFIDYLRKQVENDVRSKIDPQIHSQVSSEAIMLRNLRGDISDQKIYALIQVQELFKNKIDIFCGLTELAERMNDTNFIALLKQLKVIKLNDDQLATFLSVAIDYVDENAILKQFVEILKQNDSTAIRNLLIQLVATLDLDLFKLLLDKAEDYQDNVVLLTLLSDIALYDETVLKDILNNLKFFQENLHNLAEIRNKLQVLDDDNVFTLLNLKLQKYHADLDISRLLVNLSKLLEDDVLKLFLEADSIYCDDLMKMTILAEIALIGKKALKFAIANAALYQDNLTNLEVLRDKIVNGECQFLEEEVLQN